MRHTPTPWKWDKRLEKIEVAGEKLLLTGVSLPCGNHPKDQEARANAEYIVTCVNSHAALLEALKLTLMNAKAPEATDWPAVVERLERAIAQAEGGGHDH